MPKYLSLLCLLALMGCSLRRDPASLSRGPALPAQPASQPANASLMDEDEGDATRFFLQRRLPTGATELPADRYSAARKQVDAMPVRAAGTGSWTSLGPGNLGGRTRSLVIHPQNPAIMYAGAVTGGIWKTEDGGKNWNQLTDSLLPVLNIGALAMDATNPASPTLYAGTGEWYTSFTGQGIFKSTDGGASWNNIIKTSAFTYVNKLVISPNNSQRIYAATWTGIWLSSNAGSTWTQLLNASKVYAGCQDLVIRTDQTTDYVYASCTGAASGAAYTIWRNPDAAGAGTWTMVHSVAHMGRTSLALAPSQQSTIYAMATSIGGDPNYENGLLAVFRSTANGDAGSWDTRVANTDPNIMNTILLQDSRNVIQTVCSGGAPVFSRGQGGYDNLLAVDPLDPTRVWAGGVDLFRSDDGGANWGVASLWQIGRTSNQFAHADRHVITFHPGYNGTTNQTMFLGTDGGIFRTDNARAAVSTGAQAACQTQFVANDAVTWINLNNSYAATQFYHGAAYQGGQVYMGGSQDNAASRGNDATGVNGWVPFSTGDGAAVAVDPADANVIFESTQNLALRRSLDGGITLTSAVNGITETSTTFPFIAYLAMDPNDGRRMYLGGTTNLWRSTDSGASWSAAAPVEASSHVTAIAVSPFDSNAVLFGTQTGYIYSNGNALTSNGSTSWKSTRPRTGAVAGLAFDPTNPNVMYATYSTLNSAPTDGHVYKSVDGGATWQRSDGSGSTAVADMPVFRLLVNPYNPATLYLGTELGLLTSSDGGISWARDAAFSNVIVEDLAFDQGSSSNWLFAFTYGRGAFRIPLEGAPSTSCNYSITPATLAADAFGSVAPVTVNTAPGCAWSALPGTLFGFQSPAQGTGPGTAYVVIPAYNGTATRADTLIVAGISLPVQQNTATLTTTRADSSAAPIALNIPGFAFTDTRPLTSGAADPVHTCTGSADYKTAWWSVTPSISGTLQLRAWGRRYDVAGNSGIVLTAYAATAPATELVCATVARDTAAEVDAVVSFGVTANTTYLIEISATGNTSVDGGATYLIPGMGNPPVTVTLTPSSASLTPAGRAQQFTAQVKNSGNGAVRWSLNPPVGTITQNGLYTPPLSLSSPVALTVTATAFADSSKQASATVDLAASVAVAGPAISQVVSNTGERPLIAPNSWIEVKGVNLSTTTRLWQGSDFVNGQMPTSLDGVSVLVNGKPGFVYYISPTQVNVLTSLDAAQGTIPVTLTNALGTSPAATVSAQVYAPGFFSFNGTYAAATHANGSLLGPTSLYAGSTSPAKPGEVVILYGSGFGQTSPALVTGAAAQGGTLPALPQVTIGNLPASVQFAGVISPGLYQFNVVVPAALADGDHALVATYNGASSQPNLLLTVQH